MEWKIERIKMDGSIWIGLLGVIAALMVVGGMMSDLGLLDLKELSWMWLAYMSAIVFIRNNVRI